MRARNIRRILFYLAPFVLAVELESRGQLPPESGGLPLEVQATFSQGPQQPAAVPIFPGLQLGRNPFGPTLGTPAPGKGYQPVNGDSFACHNGSQAYNYIITSGTYWLQAGESPRVLMTLRPPTGSYAEPALLPGLGIGGRVRLFVRDENGGKWLDRFDSIDAVLAPGSARWTCSDKALGVTIKLEADPLIDRFGFIATADVTADSPKDVTLTWAFGRVGGDNDQVAISNDLAEISSPSLRYTRVLAACERPGTTAGQGDQAVLVNSDAAPQFNGPGKNRCALLVEPFKTGFGDIGRSRFVCLSGYSGFDQGGVDAAYHRLEFRPFADQHWVEQMKPKWFDHWIGQGLEPEQKFADLREHADAAAAQSTAFWNKQKQRLRIKTPDERFDTVVNSSSAMARELFEYPAFIHGLNYAKYGKINCGYYGLEAAGLHDEVADSLNFISGTQDTKSRQRYFSPAFAMSDWHEDMDFYFPEQVWWHWRWTGDRDFLNHLYPSARAALEHGLATADPNGTGLLTGYYETWNCDGNNDGGRSAVETAMGWAALRAGAQMAAVLNPYDASRAITRRPDRPDDSHRYQAYADLVERQYAAHLWNPNVGVWASAEFNGINRPRPATSEESYAIWRGLGDPLRNYTAMRFVHDNYDRGDLLPDSSIEFVNDWWPILWSVHYPATSDTCASFDAACATGQTDEFWPAFKTVAETAYINNGAIWHHTGSRTLEVEPLFLLGVVDGLFGVKPWFGENLLVLHPGFPSAWNHAEIKLTDVNYEFSRSVTRLSLHVTTPVPRQLRIELPVNRDVQLATLNGQPVSFQIEPGVRECRVVIAAPAARAWQFDVQLQPLAPSVSGPKHLIANQPATYRVENAQVIKVLDPQQKIQGLRVAANTVSGGPAEVTFVPKETGKFTVFVELRAGAADWFKPLDLEAQPPWTVAEHYIPPETKNGPALASPALDPAAKSLTLEIQNNTGSELSGTCGVTVAGRTFTQMVSAPAGGSGPVTVSLASVWDRVTPGTLPFTVDFVGSTQTEQACNWDLGNSSSDLAARQLPLDLASDYNADVRKLFSPQTQWRTDYAGAQHGVDLRFPPPPRDEHGYVLLNNVMSIYDSGILPEHLLSLTQWEMPPWNSSFSTPSGIHFQTAPNKIMALCCTEPYAQFSSAVNLKLRQPERLEKLYLLTANLTKPLKSYYPGAEIVVHYADGTTQLCPLVPPYTMPSVVDNICPRAQAIRFGQITHGSTSIDPTCFLSVTDLVLDPRKPINAFDFRCVATETLFGILGATALEAK